MSFFPIFTEIGGRCILVCGSGAHAVEKTERLIPFGAQICVIAPEIPEKIRNTPGVYIEEHKFTEKDLKKDPVFVVAAESDAENLRILEICRRHRVWVNAVDQPEACDFIFPSLISKGDLTIGISTGGTSPTAAVMLRQQIESLLAQETASILASMPRVRAILREQIQSQSDLKAALRKAVAKAFYEDRPLTDAEILSCIPEKEG